MKTVPSYVIHHADEDEYTVDWLFGKGRPGTKAVQIVAIVIGWAFAILPVVVTASALLNRNDDRDGWWNYAEGFMMWDITIRVLGILSVIFVVGFLVWGLLDRAATAKARDVAAYDEQRLERRMKVTDAWYAEKFGPEALRRERTSVRIEPYADIETYELRARYRSQGVD